MLKFVVFVLLVVTPIYTKFHGSKRQKHALRQAKIVKEPKINGTMMVPKYEYERLYRDYVVNHLTEGMKAIFVAVNIHPSCTAKKGQCIPRGKCRNMDMYYISRICYTHDLVCCYDNTIKNPTVWEKELSTTSTSPPINAAAMASKHASGTPKSKNAASAQERRHSEKTENSTELLTALLLPAENSSDWYWSLATNLTKEDIVREVNSSYKVHELNVSTVLKEFPAMAMVLDNLPISPTVNDTEKAKVLANALTMKTVLSRI